MQKPFGVGWPSVIPGQLTLGGNPPILVLSSLSGKTGVTLPSRP